MRRIIRPLVPFSLYAVLFSTAMVFPPFSTTMAVAQAPAAQASRFLGAVTAISGSTITVKTSEGIEHSVEISPATKLQRIAPGEKSLANAEALDLKDLAVGDRVLVRIAADAPATGSVPAVQVIAIKATDLAASQQKDREAWQRNGVGGLVKSVDPTTGTIVITSGVSSTAKIITIHVASSTVLRRYASDSVSFDQAKTAPISEIYAGDQLRARGQKSDEGSSLTADEIVSGTFRNVSGQILSLNVANASFEVKDLATKQRIVVHVTPDTNMRQIPEQMAKILAARMKSGNAAGGGADAAGSGGAPGGGQQRGSNDPQQMLNHLPTIQIADLKKDQAVMLVSGATQGSAQKGAGPVSVTAISLLSGVEPLLEAPAESQSSLLSNWSMGSGGGEQAP